MDKSVAMHELYNQWAAEQRGTPKQLGYGSYRSQGIRFTQAVRMLNALDPAWVKDSVLDFGCGRADLLMVLVQNGFQGTYCGVEPQRENLEDARQLTARLAGEVKADVNAGLWTGQPEELPSADWVILSGVILFLSPELKQSLLVRMQEQARKGFILTTVIPSTHVPSQPGGVYWGLPGLFSVLDAQTFKLMMHGDYLPHDVTIGGRRR